MKILGLNRENTVGLCRGSNKKEKMWWPHQIWMWEEKGKNQLLTVGSEHFQHRKQWTKLCEALQKERNLGDSPISSSYEVASPLVGPE